MVGMNGWITAGSWQEEDSRQARLIRFRRSLILETVPESLTLAITADTRYRLYVNGCFVQYGPAKPDHKVWFYDTVEIADFLKEGENTIAVLVLHYPEDVSMGNHSMFRYERPGLYICGITDTGWKSQTDRTTVFYAEEFRFAPLQIHEKAESEDICWRKNGFDDSEWQDAQPYPAELLPPALHPKNLRARMIPFMYRKPKELSLPVTEIPAGSEYSFVLDATEETCAFLLLELEGGRGSRMELLYSECYEYEDGKGDRSDSVNGHLNGYTDYVTVTGTGSSVFEPFWFRTFRFLKVTVYAGETLRLKALECEETGYPLEVKTRVETNDPTLAAISEISLRTLRRCMHETYIDCPFYEQLQYIMDTRAQILYTYAVSADDRLARRAIDDFSRAQREDGLLNCSYPNTNVNVIPGFSIYYILMVYDHMMYFGDKTLVKKYLPVIHRILEFFEKHLNKDGLVGKVGGINGEAPFWSFIDWAKEWMETQGMPAAGLFGPITLESELYLYGLIHAAQLCEYAADNRAEMYRRQAESLKKAIRLHCMKDGMITDGPGRDELSQQAQVFGVLTGIFNGNEGKKAMLRSIEDPHAAKCTVATGWYLFRALEKTGLYEYTDRFWDIWRQMIANHCTTCVEGENYPRSECHAWGALALYELPSVILGVRPASAGYQTMEVSPCTGYLESAAGTVHTLVGDVTVSWKKSGGTTEIHVSAEKEVMRRIITK